MILLILITVLYALAVYTVFLTLVTQAAYQFNVLINSEQTKQLAEAWETYREKKRDVEQEAIHYWARYGASPSSGNVQNRIKSNMYEVNRKYRPNKSLPTPPSKIKLLWRAIFFPLSLPVYFADKAGANRASNEIKDLQARLESLKILRENTPEADTSMHAILDGYEHEVLLNLDKPLKEGVRSLA